MSARVLHVHYEAKRRLEGGGVGGGGGGGGGVEGGGVGVEESREVIYTILQQYNTKP